MILRLQVAAAPAVEKTAKPAAKDAAKDEEELSPNVGSLHQSIVLAPLIVLCSRLQQYYELRSRTIKQLRAIPDSQRTAATPEPYPHKFYVTKSIPKFIEEYGAEGKIQNGSKYVSLILRQLIIVMY